LTTSGPRSTVEDEHRARLGAQRRHPLRERDEPGRQNIGDDALIVTAVARQARDALGRLPQDGNAALGRALQDLLRERRRDSRREHDLVDLQRRVVERLEHGAAPVDGDERVPRIPHECVYAFVRPRKKKPRFRGLL
jgi:hypothetical protein